MWWNILLWRRFAVNRENVSPVIYPSFMCMALWLLAPDFTCYQFVKHRLSLKGFCFTRHNVIKDLSTAPRQKVFPCDSSVKWPVLQNSKGSSGFPQNVLLCQSNGTELTGAVLLHSFLISCLWFLSFILALITSLCSAWDEDRKLPPPLNPIIL